MKPPVSQRARSGRAREWRVVPMLLPYLWEYKWRVAVALAFLVTAKLANVGVPLVLKEVVDGLDPAQAVLALPLALLVAYGLLRLSTTLFAELRDLVFVRVTQRAIRRIALNVFRHLHACRCASISSARPAACRATSSAARAASRRCSRTCCSRSSR